jgi:LmbE family N-acetylglucosaminyl deacetylase
MNIRKNDTVYAGIVIFCFFLFFCHFPVYSQISNSEQQLRIIVFGAHPDDCEQKAGGMAAIWAANGHLVKFVSTTNGDIGHAEIAGGPLAIRRTAEVKKAGEILGIESEVLDIHDGELMPTLENRKTFLRLIREWKADIVIGHRPNDYHPDHRYTGILMQDAAFMVTVTFFSPDIPPLSKNPVFLYMSDRFQKPNPFEPSIVVAIDDVFDQKADAIWTLESQIESYWATGNFTEVIPVPDDPTERQERFLAIKNRMAGRDSNIANRYRDKLIELYGEEKGRAVQYAEAFEICEYGSQPSMEELKALFLIVD